MANGDGGTGEHSLGSLTESTVTKFAGPHPTFALTFSSRRVGGLCCHHVEDSTPRCSSSCPTPARTCFSYFQNLLKVLAHPEAQDKDSWHLS